MSETSRRGPSVFVDTDLALGAARGDVDDGFALAALLAGGADIVGVSSVFGNTDEPTARRCALALLDAAGARVGGSRNTVTRGAARAGEYDTDAARVIAALPSGTTLLALGPLTNVAAALALDPSLAARIDIRFVGGNLSSRGRFAPYWPFEFNLANDAAAARAVFESPMRRRLFPLDTCTRLRFGMRDLLKLSRGGALGRYLARHSWRWLAYTPLRYTAPRFPVWDLVPALDVLGLLDPVIEERPLRLVGRGGLCRDANAGATSCVTGFDLRAHTRALALLCAG